ncbi:MAG: hypothetical protein J7L91_01610 [Candidatus Korarchaeota archaeon]|nr:hypothetical protein [Candidatus Korarchaeota archaeon]
MEIDVIRVKEIPTAVFAEIKWSNRPVDRRALSSLMRKASFPCKLGKREEVYVIYSKSGFTFSTDEAELIGLDDGSR